MKQNARSIFYHRTTAENARSIIESGFRNSAGYFLNNRTWTGVWLSSRPLDTGDDGEDDALLMVRLDIPEQQLARWEWTAEGRSYREWLIPATTDQRCHDCRIGGPTGSFTGSGLKAKVGKILPLSGGTPEGGFSYLGPPYSMTIMISDSRTGPPPAK